MHPCSSWCKACCEFPPDTASVCLTSLNEGEPKDLRCPFWCRYFGSRLRFSLDLVSSLSAYPMCRTRGPQFGRRGLPGDCAGHAGRCKPASAPGADSGDCAFEPSERSRGFSKAQFWAFLKTGANQIGLDSRLRFSMAMNFIRQPTQKW